MASNGIRNNIVIAVTAVGLLGATSALAARTEVLGNGIRATIHNAVETRELCVTAPDGTSTFSHPLAGSVLLSAPTRTLYPFDADVALAALSDMSGFTTNLDLEVFILDGIPAETGSSFARRGAIFLSPSFAPLDPAITSYIATHEVGHVLTWACIDGRAGRWEAYAALRGLDLAAAGPSAPHSKRAREILAEDLRYLFGGSLATHGIGLENHDLVTPDRIDGLRELLAGYLEQGARSTDIATSHAFPNPCNPRTTIEMVLPAGSAAGDGADVEIYDLRGQMVRKLHGDAAANDRVAVNWDGQDDAGRLVPSGRYQYVIHCATVVSRGAVTLVR